MKICHLWEFFEKKIYPARAALSMIAIQTVPRYLKTKVGAYVVNNNFNRKKKKQGRPPIIKKRESMQIKRCVETLIDTKNKVTSTKILRKLKINACTRTIQRHMKQLEYYYDKCSLNNFLDSTS